MTQFTGRIIARAHRFKKKKMLIALISYKIKTLKRRKKVPWSPRRVERVRKEGGGREGNEKEEAKEINNTKGSLPKKAEQVEEKINAALFLQHIYLFNAFF